MMTKTGLFFGSFNPIHNGHLSIAKNLVELSDLEEIWFVVSPQNPLKKKNGLLADYQRLALVKLAIEEYSFLKACDIEFTMPRPSYTIDTLNLLAIKYPDRQFILVMGSDGLEKFACWKNHEQITRQFTRYIYPRPGTPPSLLQNIPNAKIIEAPRMDISSTIIRESLSKGENVSSFLPPKVYHEIINNQLYRNIF